MLSEALGRVLRTAPPLFIPAALLPSHARTASGRWWGCTGYQRASTRLIGPIRFVFEGQWLGPGPSDVSATLTHADMESIMGHAGSIPGLITLDLTETELGQPQAGPLVRILHYHWTSEHRRHCDVPVEIECRLCPDNLLSRTQPELRKRQYQQIELDSPPSSSSSDTEAQIEAWTPATQRGTHSEAP
eukprot:371456-Rhodomonas_salina.1